MLQHFGDALEIFVPWKISKHERRKIAIKQPVILYDLVARLQS